MNKKTILILTIRFGSGHLRAAHAVAEACTDELSEYDSTVVDVTPLMPRWFRWFYVDLYLFVLRHFPLIWRRIEKVQRAQRHTAPVWMLRRTAQRIFQQIRDRDIAAICSTEVGVNEMGAILKNRYYPSAPLVAVLTDYDVDRAWIQDEVSFYCAGSSEVRDELLEIGASSERIRQTGIPVDHRSIGFKSAEKRNGGEKSNSPRPRILLAGGGEGLLDVIRILEELDSLDQEITVTVLVGKNRTLERKLRQLEKPHRIQLRVQGWTDDVIDLLHAQDVLISKPGGITITEAMAAGVPQLACFPLPGSEVKHCALVEKWGIGLSAQSWDEFREKVRKMVLDESLRRDFSAAAQRTFNEQHAVPVTEVLREALGVTAAAHHQLRMEFNTWAQSGRGEQMEEHHNSIAQAAIEEMRLQLGDRVLDLGCGTGWASRRIAERASRGSVFGVDIADAMIKRAKAHPDNPPHLCFQVSAADMLPFSENHFDKIFSCESFYYYPNLDHALAEIVRVLAPGGRFFCLVNLFKENPYTHIWVDLLKVKAHLLGEADYTELFCSAGLKEIRTRRIPDMTPIDAANFKPGWGVNTLEDLRNCRAIGALLVVGMKP